jgi:hypothetical protein
MKTAATVATTLALLVPSLVFAADAGTAVSATAGVPAATVSAKVTAKTEKLRGIGIREIDRRVAALNALVTRVGDLKRLNADAKASVTTSLTNQAQALTALKAKIQADTDEETLKADVKSVTEAYRVFALVMPQGRIVIMADTEVYVADALLTVGAKLDARIKAAAAAGKDVTALNAMLTDLGAKASDAKVQAQAAIELIANLQPDQGDKAKMEANNKALADARAKLKVGHEDLKAARANVTKIMNALKAMKLDAPVAPAAPSSSN